MDILLFLNQMQSLEPSFPTPLSKDHRFHTCKSAGEWGKNRSLLLSEWWNWYHFIYTLALWSTRLKKKKKENQTQNCVHVRAHLTNHNTTISLWIAVCCTGVQWFARHLNCEYASNFLALGGSNLIFTLWWCGMRNRTKVGHAGHHSIPGISHIQRSMCIHEGLKWGDCAWKDIFPFPPLPLPAISQWFFWFLFLFFLDFFFVVLFFVLFKFLFVCLFVVWFWFFFFC